MKAPRITGSQSSLSGVSKNHMGSGSSQKGKAVEILLAATCIIGSDGELSVSVPIVDDEGVDLIFTPKGGGRSISVQIKSRFTLTGKGHYRSHIRKKTLAPREDYYIIFAYYDQEKARLGETLWFIPTIDFVEKLKGQRKDRSNFIFQSSFDSPSDMWKPYRRESRKLPEHILRILKEKK